ncbi:MAG: MOSC domain-containing protein [Deltaproteobacteria bacterium]|nr:MOSC domain-containing protein [Deltaproteobacteria bacterium]MCB9488462.1 MOSC domain-containing protein [Deltaproteobacteria bacterium]
MGSIADAGNAGKSEIGTSPVVSRLWIYPVKACAAVPCEELTIHGGRLQGDREWVLVDAKGKMVNQLKVPRLCLVRPRVEDGRLTLSAPGRETIEVSTSEGGSTSRRVRVTLSYVPGIDAGDEAARWLSEFAGQPLRLWKFDPKHKRKSVTGRGQVAFADAYPMLVIGQSSLDDLNARVPTPLDMLRFRPNVVVDGAAPYDEDEWTTARLGELPVRGAMRCMRCGITTIDPKTGERTGKDPLATLKTYRRKWSAQVVFGRYFNASGDGVIRVGDEVTTVSF